MIKEISDVNLINSFLNKFNTNITSIGVFSHYNVYILENEIVGFLNYDLIYDRIEIDYIYVLENCRRNGIASKLLNNLISVAEFNKCKNITLEVRISNDSAIAFYKKNKFIEVAKRENYYNNEDGLLMMRKLV